MLPLRTGYILPDWGDATAARLSAAGVSVVSALEPGLAHEIGKAELKDLAAWLERILLPAVKCSGG